MNRPSRVITIVAMPAYNEEKYVGSMVLRIRKYADEVIVVDDGSADHTSEIARLAGATVVQHERNEGYGATIQTIFDEARKRKPDILVVLDADSQHDPDDIPSLAKAISEGFDIAIGSRQVQRRDIPQYRRIGQKVLSFFTNRLSRKEILDTESGFRAYSKKAVDSLELREKGMAISAEIISSADMKGLRVTEIPIHVTYTKDSSTINPVRHGLGVLARIMAMISERRPLMFFGFFGGILIVLGIVAGIMVTRIVYAEQVLQTGTALVAMLLVTLGALSIFTGLILNVLVKRIKDLL